MELSNKPVLTHVIKPLSRDEFRRNLISYFKIFYLSLIPGLLLFGYGKYTLNIDFTFAGILVLCAALIFVQTKTANKASVFNRLIDIYPELQNVKQRTWGYNALSLVPLFSLFLLIFLWRKEGGSKKPAPYLLTHPQSLLAITAGVYFSPILIVFLGFFQIGVGLPFGKLAYWFSDPSVSYISYVAEDISIVIKNPEGPYPKQLSVASLLLYTAKQASVMSRKPAQEPLKVDKINQYNQFLAQVSENILIMDTDMIYSRFNPIYILSTASMVTFILVAGVDELLTEKFSLSLIEKFHEMSQKMPEMNWAKFNSLVEKSKMWKRAQHAKNSFALSQLDESL